MKYPGLAKTHSSCVCVQMELQRRDVGGGTITGYQHQEGLLALSSAPPTWDIWISHFHMDVYGYNGYMYRVIFFTGPPLNSLSMENLG